VALKSNPPTTDPPRRTCLSHLAAKVLAFRRPLRLGVFARQILFLSFTLAKTCPPRRAERRAAKKLWSTPIRKWGNSLPIRLGGPGQALDKGVGGIYSRQALRGRQSAEPQRNCGALGMTFRRGGLAWRLCCLPRPRRRMTCSPY
jgi:hypothetical protein